MFSRRCRRSPFARLVTTSCWRCTNSCAGKCPCDVPNVFFAGPKKGERVVGGRGRRKGEVTMISEFDEEAVVIVSVEVTSVTETLEETGWNVTVESNTA